LRVPRGLRRFDLSFSVFLIIWLGENNSSEVLVPDS